MFLAPRTQVRPLSISAAAQAAIVAAMPFLFLIVLTFHPPQQSLMQLDSDGYLNFSSIRTGGYPFFLAMVRLVTADPARTVYAQMLLYALSTAAVGWQVLRLSDNILATVALQGLLLWNPAVYVFHFTVMTESVFLSATLFFLTGTIAYLRNPSVAALIVAAVSAAAAATIRPTGLTIIPATILLTFLVDNAGRRKGWHLIMAIFTAGAVLLAENVYYHRHHPLGRVSLAPIHLLAKSGLIAIPNPDVLVRDATPEEVALQRALETGLVPVRRLIAEAPNAQSWCRLTANYETFLQYQFAPLERSALVAKEGNEGITRQALARILQAPGAYLRMSAQNLHCLWTLWAASNEEKSALQSYLAERRPLPFDPQIFNSLATSQSIAMVGFVPPFMYGIGIIFAVVPIFIIFAVIRRRVPNRWISIVGLSGIVVHGTLLATAFFGVSIPRYTLVDWPPLCVGVVALAMLVWNRLRPMIRGRALSLSG